MNHYPCACAGLQRLLRVAGPLVLIVSTSLLWTASQATAAENTGNKDRFRQLSSRPWREVFHDDGTGDWRQKWTLDGLKAKVINSPQGMDFHAGRVADEDASHAVLWTKDAFRGDIKVEYEFTRLDSASRYVVILYLQATGSGVGPYAKDIAQWSGLRTIPAMRTYFDHMNAYHVSYAAFGNDNADPSDDYLRARRYMPLTGKGLKGTELEEEYRKTGLFKTGVPHRITVIKTGSDLFMHVKNEEKELLCHWNATSLPPILEGRVGLRHMATRSARYRDFHISVLSDKLAVAADANTAERAKTVRVVAPKLKVPTISAQQSLQSFEARRKRLLEELAGKNATARSIADPAQDVYATRAIANLYLGRFTEAANARIRRTAEWFEHEHPRHRPIQGECDFAATKLCQAYYLLKDTGKLEPVTMEAIKRFFFTKDFHSIYGSENHHLMFRSSRYLMGLAFPDATFAAFGKKGRELAVEDVAWLRNYLRFRARRGWGEFDAQGYISVDWESVMSLYERADDEELRKLSRMMLDLLLVDIASDSLHGLYGGAHGRGDIDDHATAPAYPLQYLYFGNVDYVGDNDPHARFHPVALDAVVSSYRPPEIIVDLAIDRPHSYVNLERKHLHNPDDVMPEKPLAGSIRKYTWYTPEFLLGCVQWQDPYPDNRRSFDRYARHQQQDWELTIGTRSGSRLFTHHPGDTVTHEYWKGDTRCRCGSFFQHEGALVALYDIPKRDRFQFIHAWVPKAALDEIVEEDGILFVREGNVCAALRLTPGYEWTTEGAWRDKEVKCRGGCHAVICEAAKLSDAGSFAAFRREIEANRVDFDIKKMDLTYHSKRYGVLHIDTKGARELNGKPAPLDYPTYGNPYVHSAWDSGIVEIAKDGRRLLLDFPAAKRTLSDVKESKNHD